MRVLRIFTMLFFAVLFIIGLYIVLYDSLCGINLVTNRICGIDTTWKFTRRVNQGYSTKHYGDNTCGDNPNRDVLHAIFKRWVEIAEINNITYFLTTGTLLGAWRNEDIIPYDRDIDVLIDGRDNVKLELIKDERNFVESDNKFHLILEEDWRQPYNRRRRFKCNGKLVSRYSDHCSFQEPLGRLIKGYHHLDIYDYKLENGMLSDPSEWEKKYPSTEVFPLKKCKFMGIMAYCPKNPKPILQAFYGKNLNSTKKCENKIWVQVDK